MNRYLGFSVPNYKIVCACGCKELLDRIDRWGQVRIYKHNHHMRGKKRTELAIKNMSLGKLGIKNPAWKGGRYKHQGYIHIYKPEHPYANDGYIMEHRLVMEKHLGRYLTVDEIVHHINENRSDNRLKNLTILSQSEHLALHRKRQKISAALYHLFR